MELLQEQIKELWLDGASDAAIAILLGRSRQRIHQIRISIGLREREWTNRTEAARALGISKTTIQNLIRDGRITVSVSNLVRPSEIKAAVKKKNK